MLAKDINASNYKMSSFFNVIHVYVRQLIAMADMKFIK